MSARGIFGEEHEELPVAVRFSQPFLSGERRNASSNPFPAICCVPQAQILFKSVSGPSPTIGLLPFFKISQHLVLEQGGSGIYAKLSIDLGFPVFPGDS